MGTFGADIRYSLRLSLRHPGFTAVAVLTLAFGVGAVTSIFSLASGVLLRPLPYTEPSQLVALFEAFPKLQAGGLPFSPPDLETVRRLNQSLASLAAFDNRERELSGVAQSERIMTARTTRQLFPLLGVRTALGRTFTAEDEAAGRTVAVISDGLWRRAYAADPRVLGRTLMLDRVPHTIVGVLPAGIDFPPRGPQFNSEPADVFVPRIFTPDELSAYGNGFNESVVGRLKPGVSIERLRAELGTLVARLEEPYPGELKADPRFGLGLSAEPLGETIVGNVRPLLLVLLGAVGMLLLVGCANVANLLLVRASGRQREFAMRSALGAGRPRLIRQLLVESAILAAGGGLLGVIFALWGTDLLVAGLPISVPRQESIRVDLPVLAFALMVSLATTLIFGLAPALHLTRHSTSESLKEGGRGSTAGRRRSRLLAAVVTAQFALALMLSIGGGLLMRSFARLLATDGGFRAEQVLTVSTRLPEATYPTGPQVRAFYRELVDRVGRLPGVTVAAGSTALPLVTTERRMFSLEHPPESGARTMAITALVCVQGEYFKALRVPIRQGRPFADADSKSGMPPVVVVNETLARQFFQGSDPVGQRIKFGGAQSDAPWMTLVGVVADIKGGPLNEPVLPTIYQPFAQTNDVEVAGFFRWMDLAIRAEGVEPTALVTGVRRAVRELDAALPISDVLTMEQRVANSVKPQRFYTLLISSFAWSALLLAAIGLWGVLATSVAHRRQEFGVRLALGAGPGQLIRIVVGQGMLYAGTGLLIGLAGAAGASRVLARFLYQVEPTDPLTFATVGLLLALVGLLASYLPAVRATRVDPLTALRHE